MRLLGRLCFLVVALLWVPLTAHCRIASLPGLEFLRCGEDHAPADKHDHSSCEDCGCCSQESGKYHSARWKDLTPDVHPDLLSHLDTAWVEAGLPAEESTGVLTAAPPPPRLASWHFLLRLALPVRAPSSAS